MTVLVIVPESDDAAFLLDWASALSEAEESLEVICLNQETEEHTAALVAEGLNGADLRIATIRSVMSAAPVPEILEACRRQKPRLLVTGGFRVTTTDGRLQTTLDLIRRVSCMAIAPMSGSTRPAKIKRLLTLISSEQLGVSTLRLSEMLSDRFGAATTVATVEDDSGSRARNAGEKAVQELLGDAGLDEHDYEIKVAVDALRHRGVLSCFDGHDAVICDLSTFKDVSPLRQALGEATTLVVKRAPPVRLRSVVDWLPRINPRDHAELLQDLRSGSEWSGDFSSMLALASGIASLGLMQNSPAVVIGSMLLAPLMTPMIGMGLALAQANIRMAKRCSRSIAYGLLLTLTVSFLLGMVTPSRETLAPEVLSRGEPNVLDLLIALLAAVAATIAMSRPNISGALAGVAIATALVPPLCAVGLSASHGSYTNAFGALLLFGTNLIAIIVASSLTFRGLGIQTGRAIRRHRRFATTMKVLLSVMLLLLAGPLSQRFLTQLERGRTQPGLLPVTRAVHRALTAHVDKDPDIDLTLLGRAGVSDSVVIYIAARRDVSQAYADELRSIVRAEMESPELVVYVVCLNGQWLSKQ